VWVGGRRTSWSSGCGRRRRPRLQLLPSSEHTCVPFPSLVWHPPTDGPESPLLAPPLWLTSASRRSSWLGRQSTSKNDHHSAELVQWCWTCMLLLRMVVRVHTFLMCDVCVWTVLLSMSFLHFFNLPLSSSPDRRATPLNQLRRVRPRALAYATEIITSALPL
jgi:hypothetical protein